MPESGGPNSAIGKAYVDIGGSMDGLDRALTDAFHATAGGLNRMSAEVDNISRSMFTVMLDSATDIAGKITQVMSTAFGAIKTLAESERPEMQFAQLIGNYGKEAVRQQRETAAQIIEFGRQARMPRAEAYQLANQLLIGGIDPKELGPHMRAAASLGYETGEGAHRAAADLIAARRGGSIDPVKYNLGVMSSPMTARAIYERMMTGGGLKWGIFQTAMTDTAEGFGKAFDKLTADIPGDVADAAKLQIREWVMPTPRKISAGEAAQIERDALKPWYKKAASFLFGGLTKPLEDATDRETAWAFLKSIPDYAWQPNEGLAASLAGIPVLPTRAEKRHELAQQSRLVNQELGASDMTTNERQFPGPYTSRIDTERVGPPASEDIRELNETIQRLNRNIENNGLGGPSGTKEEPKEKYFNNQIW